MKFFITNYRHMIISKSLGVCALLKLDPSQRINLQCIAKNAFLWDIPLEQKDKFAMCMT